MSSTPVTMTLDDEMPWHPHFQGRDDFYDDIGFTLTAETEDHDIMVGNFLYHFQGGKEFPKSQWLGNGLVNNNLVIISPKSQRGKGMVDNNFARNGMNLNDYFDLDDLEVIRTDDSVTYKFLDMEYYCSPPYWRMSGRSGTVEYDLHYRQQGTSVAWPFGTREDAINNGMGGGYVYLTCEGTIKVDGQLYPIKNGRGVHERLVSSQVLDQVPGAAADTTGFGSAFAMHILDGDVWVWALGMQSWPMVYVTVEGKEIEFMAGAGMEPSEDSAVKVSYTPSEPWHDPRSGMYMPSRWTLECESEDGKFVLDARAVSRVYYPWEMKRGYQMMYWHLGVANGSFTCPDGRVIPIKDQLFQHEIVKVMINHNETLQGPDLSPSFEN